MEIAAAQAEEESDVSTLEMAFYFLYVKFSEMKTNRWRKQADNANKITTTLNQTSLGVQLEYFWFVL